MRGLLLAALLEGPGHGYELMGRLETATGGRWRPSPGSVYPLLQLLEDEGLVRGRDQDGRRVYELTDEGRERAAEEQARLRELTAEDPDGSPYGELRSAMRELHLAARQVAAAGGSGQVEQAVTVVRDARQALYRLLADQ